MVQVVGECSLGIFIEFLVLDFWACLESLVHRLEVHAEDVMLLFDIGKNILEIFGDNELIPEREVEEVLLGLHLSSEEIDELEEFLDQQESDKFRVLDLLVIESILSD